MNCSVKVVFAVVVLSVAGMTFGVTVNYTGNGSSPDQLNDAGNWDGTVDANADLVVDYAVLNAKTGKKDMGFNKDLAAHSLTLTGFSAKNPYLSSGNSTLTIGAGGIVSDASVFDLNCRTTLAASQTWKVRGLSTRFAVGGAPNQTLTISQEDAPNAAYIIHRTSLKFPGSLVYSKITNTDVFICGNELWATNVTMQAGSNDYKTYICPNERVRWRDLIPGTVSLGRSFYTHGWVRDYGGDPAKYGDGLIVIDDNVGNFFTRTINNMMGAGVEVATGGTFSPSSYFLTLGKYWSNGSQRFKTQFKVSGGTATVENLWLGGQVQDMNNTGSGLDANFDSTGHDADRLAEVSAGTLKTSKALSVGGAENSHTGNALSPAAYCQMKVSGGTLNMSPDSSVSTYAENLRGLYVAPLLCAIPGNSLPNILPTSPGVYTQTGGEATAGRVMFGANAYADYGGSANGNLPALYEGFGLFELCGGTFNLGNDKCCLGFSLGRNWNAAVTKNWVTGDEIANGVGSATGPAEGDSSYKIALSGGTLSAKAALANTLAVTVPANGTGATLETATTFSQQAPLEGHGTLKKSGAGTLELTDAVRFRGNLSVDAGAVILAGTNLVANAVAEDCSIWTADEAVKGLSEGADVTTWADSTGNYTAVLDDSGDDATGNRAPRVKLNTMNGHAALEFWQTPERHTNAAMIVKSNPLKGCTELSMVVVLRPQAGGNGDGMTASGLLASKTVLGTMSGNNSFALQHPGNIYSHFALAAVQGSGTDNMKWVYSGNDDDYSYALNQTSVLIATLKDRKMTLSIDGRRTETTFNGEAEDFPRISGTDKFGICRNTVYGGAVRGFVGDIAEIRIYRNRALSVREENALAYSLLAKYDGDASRLAGLYVAAAGNGEGGFSGDLKAASEVPAGPAAATVWTASDIVSAGEAGKAPALVAGTLGGKDVARFDGTAFSRVAAASSPLSGKGEFTVQVVFRTTFDGEGGKSGDTGLGLLSTRQIGQDIDDFAVTFNRHGSLGCHIGRWYTTDKGVHGKYLTYKPCHLDDGEGHVAFFAYSKSARRLTRMTDGMYMPAMNEQDSDSNRASLDLLIGSLTPTNGFFRGDIAEVRFYDSVLTRAEMLAAAKKAAADYDFTLLSQAAYAAEDLPHGLGATNITVASGAKLLLPRSTTAPLTLGAGQSISGEGTVAGTVKLGPGGVLDATSAAPRKIENLVLAGGTVTFDADDPQMLVVGDLDVTAGGTLLVKGSLESKLAFFSYDTLTGELAALTVTSDSGKRLKVINDPDNKRLVIKQDKGLLILVR